MSFKDTNEKRLMHLKNSKSDNIEIMINNNMNEVIGELFQLLFSGYQISLET